MEMNEQQRLEGFQEGAFWTKHPVKFSCGLVGLEGGMFLGSSHTEPQEVALDVIRDTKAFI